MVPAYSIRLQQNATRFECKKTLQKNIPCYSRHDTVDITYFARVLKMSGEGGGGVVTVSILMFILMYGFGALLLSGI